MPSVPTNRPPSANSQTSGSSPTRQSSRDWWFDPKSGRLHRGDRRLLVHPLESHASCTSPPRPIHRRRLPVPVLEDHAHARSRALCRPAAAPAASAAAPSTCSSFAVNRPSSASIWAAAAACRASRSRRLSLISADLALELLAVGCHPLDLRFIRCGPFGVRFSSKLQAGRLPRLDLRRVRRDPRVRGRLRCRGSRVAQPSPRPRATSVLGGRRPRDLRLECGDPIGLGRVLIGLGGHAASASRSCSTSAGCGRKSPETIPRRATRKASATRTRSLRRRDGMM